MSFFNLKPNYTDADLKKEYHRLCKLYHPDLGGEQATFKAMGAEYRSLLNREKPRSPPSAPPKEPSHNKPKKDKIFRVHIPPYGDVLYYPRTFAGAGFNNNVFDVYLPGIAFDEGCVVDFGTHKIRIHPKSKEGATVVGSGNGKKSVHFWIDPSDK